jgi:3-hydroxybutyryl-CoA dehydrogenase
MKELAGFHRITNVTIIGAGVMGRGMAVAFATHGIKTVLFDVDSSVLKTAIVDIRKTKNRLVRLGVIKKPERTLNLVRADPNLESALSSSQLVIESVPENLELKMNVFKEIDRLVPSHVILATNTSGLSISKLSSVCTNPNRVIGIHFFAPAYILKTIEIVPGEKTSAETIRAAERFAIDIGKSPITLRKDSSNFVVNSIQFAMMNEAKRLIAAGIVGSMADIDRAICRSFPIRQALFGIFRDSDLISPYSSLTHAGRKDLATNYEYSTREVNAIALRDAALIELETAAEKIRTTKLADWG